MLQSLVSLICGKCKKWFALDHDEYQRFAMENWPIANTHP
jgi:hypothetical protein